jgi:hypothetical protein
LIAQSRNGSPPRSETPPPIEIGGGVELQACGGARRFSNYGCISAKVASALMADPDPLCATIQ